MLALLPWTLMLGRPPTHCLAQGTSHLLPASIQACCAFPAFANTTVSSLSLHACKCALHVNHKCESQITHNPRHNPKSVSLCDHPVHDALSKNMQRKRDAAPMVASACRACSNQFISTCTFPFLGTYVPEARGQVFLSPVLGFPFSGSKSFPKSHLFKLLKSLHHKHVRLT